MLKITGSRIAIAAAVLSLGLSAPALAQTQPQPPVQQQPGAASQNIPDEKIDSFVMAFLEVDKVNREYQPRMQAAGDDAERQQLQDEAGRKMVEAVESTDGITPDEYTSIMNAAQADTDLVNRINTRIREQAQ